MVSSFSFTLKIRGNLIVLYVFYASCFHVTLRRNFPGVFWRWYSALFGDKIKILCSFGWQIFSVLIEPVSAKDTLVCSMCQEECPTFYTCRKQSKWKLIGPMHLKHGIACAKHLKTYILTGLLDDPEEEKKDAEKKLYWNCSYFSCFLLYRLRFIHFPEGFI